MKIAMVSVFPPNTNGIGDYTHDLCRAIRQDEVVVIADRANGRAAELEMDVAVAVDRCWRPDGDWVADVVAGVERACPQVVHVQHGGYMGRDARLPTLLDELRRRGVRTVVTLHGVYPQTQRSLWRPNKWSPARFHHALGEHADRIVIHQRAGAYDPLIAHGVPAARIAVIPHGTPAAPALAAHDARATLGLAHDRPIALFLGFIGYSKGVDTVARAFRDVAARVRGALLVIAGHVEQHDLQDRLYGHALEWRLRRGRREGWIEYRPGYLPAGDIPAYLAAADVVVFPYRQEHGSASGVLHRALAAGRAVVCSRGPKFLDTAGAFGDDTAIVLPGPTDLAAWSESLVRVLSDEGLRARLARASSELGRASAWPVVGDKHSALYREVVGGGGAR